MGRMREPSSDHDSAARSPGLSAPAAPWIIAALRVPRCLPACSASGADDFLHAASCCPTCLPRLRDVRCSAVEITRPWWTDPPMARQLRSPALDGADASDRSSAVADATWAMHLLRWPGTSRSCWRRAPCCGSSAAAWAGDALMDVRVQDAHLPTVSWIAARGTILAGCSQRSRGAAHPHRRREGHAGRRRAELRAQRCRRASGRGVRPGIPRRIHCIRRARPAQTLVGHRALRGYRSCVARDAIAAGLRHRRYRTVSRAVVGSPALRGARGTARGVARGIGARHAAAARSARVRAWCAAGCRRRQPVRVGGARAAAACPCCATMRSRVSSRWATVLSAIPLAATVREDRTRCLLILGHSAWFITCGACLAMVGCSPSAARDHVDLDRVACGARPLLMPARVDARSVAAVHRADGRCAARRRGRKRGIVRCAVGPAHHVHTALRRNAVSAHPDRFHTLYTGPSRSTSCGYGPSTLELLTSGVRGPDESAVSRGPRSSGAIVETSDFVAQIVDDRRAGRPLPFVSTFPASSKAAGSSG